MGSGGRWGGDVDKWSWWLHKAFIEPRCHCSFVNRVGIKVTDDAVELA